MKKKASQPSLQSSFFSGAGIVTTVRLGISKPIETEVVVEFLDFPKIVRSSLHCPDCGSAVRLMPDGTGRCPECVVKIPYKTVRVREAS